MKYFPIFKTLALLATLLPSPLAAQAPESVMVVEAYSGKILIAANATAKRPIASLTKIATAVVTVDWASATDTDLGSTTITVPQTVTLVGGPNPMNLQPGDQLSLRDALYSALLGSDNLAALAIADHVGREILTRRGQSGDPVAAFVGEMNQLAKALGMRRNAINFIVRQKDRQVSVSGPAGQRGYRVKNLNELVGEPGILGVKTGMTNAAGPCVSVCMDREPLVRPKPDGTKGATPRRLIVVVLNNPDRFNRARGLISQGWSIYDPWLESGAPVQDPKREILSLPSPQ